MGAACAGIAGVVVALVSVGIVADEWLDRDVRLAAVFGILIGVGAVLNAVGVW